MISKLKRQPARKTFERFEGDFRNVTVEEINKLIDQINNDKEKEAVLLITDAVGFDPVTTIKNNISDSVTLTRLSAGVFELTFVNKIPGTLVMPNDYTLTIDGALFATVQFVKMSDNLIRIGALDVSGINTDGLLLGGSPDRPLLVEFKIYA